MDNDDAKTYKPVETSSAVVPHSILLQSLKRTSGFGWTINPDPHLLLPYDYECLWIDFESTTGKVAKMCGHDPPDGVTSQIQRNKRLQHCNALPRMWNEATEVENNSNNNIYLEIGANIGSCVLEMLLSTNAKIIAFEPHPKNLFVLRHTLLKLESTYQERVVVVPVALGKSNHANSTIYAARGNMGNSVLGKIIKDYGNQEFTQQDQHVVPVERLDSILLSDRNSNSIHAMKTTTMTNKLDEKSYQDPTLSSATAAVTKTWIPLAKMDAQGFECNILNGWTSASAHNIRRVKFEVAPKWLKNQNCHDLFTQFRSLGYQLSTLQGKEIDGGESNQFRGMIEILATQNKK